MRRKQRLPHHYIVNTEREGSYTATLVRGKSLCVSEAMAESLLQYCEKALCIRISELVIDLTVDREKKLWFHELKGVKSHALTRLW